MVSSSAPDGVVAFESVAAKSAKPAVDPVPMERVFVTVGEQRWELVHTQKLTWPETKEAKRISGMPLVDMEAAIQKADPDAWFAWMYVSIRRQWPSLTERELEAAIGDTPLVAVIETTEREAFEVAAPDPPTRAPESGANEPRNGSDSGEQTPQPLTLATSGHQT